MLDCTVFSPWKTVCWSYFDNDNPLFIVCPSFFRDHHQRLVCIYEKIQASVMTRTPTLALCKFIWSLPSFKVWEMKLVYKVCSVFIKFYFWPDWLTGILVLHYYRLTRFFSSIFVRNSIWGFPLTHMINTKLGTGIIFFDFYYCWLNNIASDGPHYNGGGGDVHY
jgi:hypothetical protein